MSNIAIEVSSVELKLRWGSVCLWPISKMLFNTLSPKSGLNSICGVSGSGTEPRPKADRERALGARCSVLGSDPERLAPGSFDGEVILGEQLKCCLNLLLPVFVLSYLTARYSQDKLYGLYHGALFDNYHCELGAVSAKTFSLEPCSPCSHESSVGLSKLHPQSLVHRT